MPNFDLEKHNAYWADMARKFPGAGWETHGPRCPCRGDFSITSPLPVRDPSQPNHPEEVDLNAIIAEETASNYDDIPVDKTFDDGQRIP